MSNMFQNRIDIAMTPAQITGAKTGLQAVQTNLPFLLGLTTDERIALPKINVANKVFVEDAINAITNNAAMLPAYLDVVKMQTDLSLFLQLDELAQICRQMLEKIEDTQMLAGSEAYISALTAYKLFSAAAMAGVPGTDSIYAQLKARFENNGGNAEVTPLPA